MSVALDIDGEGYKHIAADSCNDADKGRPVLQGLVIVVFGRRKFVGAGGY